MSSNLTQSRDHVVMFSGGAASYIAAKRVIAEHGRERTHLLFADTGIEDEDLYRFLKEAVAKLGANFVTARDGRTPWELFRENGMMGNTRADLCSRILKRELLDNVVRTVFTNPVLYFGFDFTEAHRLEGVRRAKPWAQCEAPLLEPPLLWKEDMLAEMRADGIEPSRAYVQGFSHDNCGGFCVKAGQGHFKQLLAMRRSAYLHHEAEEQKFRADTGKDVAILRDRRGGVTRPLTLRDLRKRIEEGDPIDEDDVGGCNCFVPPDLD